MSERHDVQSGADDATIVRAAIYPAIGVARLGTPRPTIHQICHHMLRGKC
jgi:hypothetical protein